MRSISLRLHILAVIALTAILFVCTSGHHISFDGPSLTSDDEFELTRARRQIESFDAEDYPTTANEEQQDEAGFWDRVVRVALKLFSRFIEWLNS
ncbi:uncharacterized protein LOC126366810 [Pectinophora gossypiella]|uniref:uncharacterized protein LOC126366810 n=1 Tax=Pectinophora gossypiella TaxID=13191 RepID=UPI00214E1C02|nr:uncharacterized protein LOC126366810 [Pectinophora gossypiella]